MDYFSESNNRSRGVSIRPSLSRALTFECQQRLYAWGFFLVALVLLGKKLSYRFSVRTAFARTHKINLKRNFALCDLIAAKLRLRFATSKLKITSRIVNKKRQKARFACGIQHCVLHPCAGRYKPIRT